VSLHFAVKDTGKSSHTSPLVPPRTEMSFSITLDFLLSGSASGSGQAQSISALIDTWEYLLHYAFSVLVQYWIPLLQGNEYCLAFVLSSRCGGSESNEYQFLQSKASSRVELSFSYCGGCATRSRLGIQVSEWKHQFCFETFSYAKSVHDRAQLIDFYLPCTHKAFHLS
jgi:hypothetical protein